MCSSAAGAVVVEVVVSAAGVVVEVVVSVVAAPGAVVVVSPEGVVTSVVVDSVVSVPDLQPTKVKLAPTTAKPNRVTVNILDFMDNSFILLTVEQQTTESRSNKK